MALRNADFSRSVVDRHTPRSNSTNLVASCYDAVTVRLRFREFGKSVRRKEIAEDELLLRQVVVGRCLLGGSFRVSCPRLCGHRTFRIEQVVAAWPQSEPDKRTRIRNRLRLPSVICLVAPHGGLRGAIPRSRRLALHVVLADERRLNFPGARRVDPLLAALLGDLFAASLFCCVGSAALAGR
jgi:hypothetical protein